MRIYIRWNYSILTLFKGIIKLFLEPFATHDLAIFIWFLILVLFLYIFRKIPTISMQNPKICVMLGFVNMALSMIISTPCLWTKWMMLYLSQRVPFVKYIVSRRQQATVEDKRPHIVLINLWSNSKNLSGSIAISNFTTWNCRIAVNTIEPSKMVGSIMQVAFGSCFQDSLMFWEKKVHAHSLP